MIKLWKAPDGGEEQRATGESPKHSLKRGKADDLHILCMSRNKKTDIITFGELKPAILNWEDYDWEDWEE